MRILVDTKVWLWMLAEPERLSAKSRALLASAEIELLFSAASRCLERRARSCRS